MMIETIEQYIFWYKSDCPWPLFKVTGVQESKNFCVDYITKFAIVLDGIWYTVELKVW